MKNFSGQLLKIRITAWALKKKEEENCDFVDAIIDVLYLDNIHFYVE